MKRIPFAVALLLEKRKPKGTNIVIGSDSVVIKALEKKFQTAIAPFDKDNPTLFSYLESELDVPAALRDSVSIWLNPPLSKNPDVLRYLVSSLHPEFKKEQCDSFVKCLSYDSNGFRNFNTLYWVILSGRYEEIPWVKDPWENPNNWLGQMNIGLRLNWLHTNVVGYVYAKDDNKQGLEKLGISFKKANHLKGLNLSNNKMFRTLLELSKWRSNRQNELQTALLITNIWES